jgi:hypothetical protein
MPRRRFSIPCQFGLAAGAKSFLTLQVHIREGRDDSNVFGGGELHALISFAINSVSHDCGFREVCVDVV